MICLEHGLSVYLRYARDLPVIQIYVITIKQLDFSLFDFYEIIVDLASTSLTNASYSLPLNFLRLLLV